MRDFGEELGRANKSLDKVQIRQKGDRLYLRATLPAKPGDGEKPKRYELSTGYGTHSEGLKFAKAKALEIEGQLLRENFDWTPWLKNKHKPAETVREWLVKFEDNYWESREKSLAKLSTWKASYQEAFNRLDSEKPLTEGLLRAEILTSKASTRTREKLCFAYGAIARFAGIEVKFSELAVGCGAKIQRELPSDLEIEAMRDTIANPAWRWVFGMLATYGLRPHEVYKLDCSELGFEPGWLRVLPDTKTKERLVLPLKPKWRSDWQLWEVTLPNTVTAGKTNQQIGAKVTPSLHERGIQLTAYHLRDAYAVRASVLGIDPAIVARWMGHSLKTHFEKYHKHISKRDFEEAWRRATTNDFPVK
ncbi:MAG: hypothetical protein EAZ18_00405 [Oscillatoriales cyanobacterium]|nr:MAG: hypothetical protein EAZ18_00405 [Oscillatoriales cyanobacterium]